MLVTKVNAVYAGLSDYNKSRAYFANKGKPRPERKAPRVTVISKPRLQHLGQHVNTLA